MKRIGLVVAEAIVLALFAWPVQAQDTPAFVLHVTHVKSEYVGDKPTQNDCKKIPCTTLIVTVEAHSVQTDFILECKQWVLLTDPIQNGKCWGLETAKEYPTRRAGRSLLFYDDKPDTNPLYMVIEEAERKSK
jgi:hypothetical protein